MRLSDDNGPRGLIAKGIQTQSNSSRTLNFGSSDEPRYRCIIEHASRIFMEIARKNPCRQEQPREPEVKSWFRIIVHLANRTVKRRSETPGTVEEIGSGDCKSATTIIGVQMHPSCRLIIPRRKDLIPQASDKFPRIMIH